jgi:DNA-binding transcriptional MerR regulator
MSPTTVTYRTRAFAALAGVTVRALHHYDRIGLLSPRRTPAGYRVYVADDIQALEQIVVLKFIGLSLRDIAALRRGSTSDLSHRLRAQRGALQRKRALLDQAILAIQELEAHVAGGQQAEPALFTRIIEVIEMQHDTDALKREYEALVEAKIGRLQSLSPQALADMRAQWAALVGEIRTALAEDPDSAAAQALGDRWTQLLGTLMGQSLGGQLIGRHQRAQGWSPSMASFVDKPVWDFMTRVLAKR